MYYKNMEKSNIVTIYINKKGTAVITLQNLTAKEAFKKITSSASQWMDTVQLYQPART